jgi:hypothetical protein
LDENLKQSVDLQSQADSFMGIASAAVRGLVRQVEVALEPSWREMRNTPWAKIEAVSDQSSYVGEMLSRTKEKATEILQLLHKQQYARAFSDHLVELISSQFISNVFQCRPLSETGAEQVRCHFCVILHLTNSIHRCFSIPILSRAVSHPCCLLQRPLALSNV